MGAPFLVNIFLESQLASHTAAAALLFGQMMRCGAAVEVVPEDILTATLSEFTDLAQICVRCPFDYGVLDGIILLLSQLLAQTELPMASLYLDHGIWSILWHRVAQMLQVQNPETDMPLHDIETEGFEVAMTSARSIMPDWTLLSFSGLVAMLHMAIVVFTKETFQVVTCLADPDNIVTLTLLHLLSPEFLQSLSNSALEGGVGAPVSIVHPVVQLCCFPFAIDMNSELLEAIQTCFAGRQLLPRLLHASVTYLKPLDLDLPIGLISRLVLADTVFVEQFSHCVDDLKLLLLININADSSSRR
ncbi:Serine/threonine-protein kinase 36 [Lamellibrachia satsuma]|nr:Serine/threonine-protein kinase 36 [Lamellibrachia satsuma]